MLKQHRELSMFVHGTIENNEEAGIKITLQGKYGMFPNNIMPKNLASILTDQCGSMQMAHHEEDPKQIKRLQATRKNQTRDEPCRLKLDAFDKNWNNFVAKYGVGGNKWLSGNRAFGLYELMFSFIWITTFGPGCEAHKGARECMHTFFSKFITRNSSLIQFVKQYNNCLASRDKERENLMLQIFTPNIGSILACVYSQEVQAQFREKVNCITRSMHSTLDFTTYKVVEKVSNSTFNKCQCLLFESRDILCRHSLSILSFERVDKVASKYILERWNISRAAKASLYRSREARDSTIWLFESEELTGILYRAFDNIMAEIKSLLSHEDATLSDVNELQSPPRVRTRGHPNNRLGSNMEKKIANATKKKKKPSLSELNLLNGGSIIQSSSSLYDAQDMNYPGQDYKGLERTADSFGSLMVSDALITWSLNLFILCKRMVGPYSCLKSSISSYNPIERNYLI
ncbi:hypothetical protein Ahy_A07g036315 isoform A [Arachis hypogaea]|uniref:Protein FAR1-RELATED SEQUENCE n=1 Tax=Arachis hypogaea TaxID=3818 RepID=A0A445CFV3_ARAHY|nr:hypothetical protein Ahy_A07g036315 isoform A [Arachis hypogaea]